MADPMRLRMGTTDGPSPAVVAHRVEILKATILKYLPDFAAAVAGKIHGRVQEGAPGTGTPSEPDTELDLLVLHQDAFASGYFDDEYTLLGMAIKYAGLHGLPVHVIGTNGETC